MALMAWSNSSFRAPYSICAGMVVRWLDADVQTLGCRWWERNAASIRCERLRLPLLDRLIAYGVIIAAAVLSLAGRPEDGSPNVHPCKLICFREAPARVW